jgi:hypothetical protein
MPKRNIYDSIKLDNLLDLCDIPDNDPILKHVNDNYMNNIINDIFDITYKQNFINQLKPLLDNIKSTCLQLKNISDKEHINLTQKSNIELNIRNLVITYKNLSKLIE